MVNYVMYKMTLYSYESNLLETNFSQFRYVICIEDFPFLFSSSVEQNY